MTIPTTYLVKRLFYMLLTLWVVLTFVFVATYTLPGNVAEYILGTRGTVDNIGQLEAELGLDQPFFVRYVDWLVGILSGNWGESLYAAQPVIEIVTPPLIRSLELALLTMLLVIVTAIPFGVLAAYKSNTWIEDLINSAGYFGMSVPHFVIGTILILLIASPPYSFFPSGGYVPLSEGLFAWLHHLMLPAVSLALVLFAHIMQQTKSGVLESLRSEYVRTARLKGLSETSVIFKHALRNGLLPAITVIALDFGFLVGGIVVVEEVFTYPGIGRLMVRAIETRDIPLIQISILFPTAVYVIVNFLADVLYTFLDPRIEYR